MAEPTLMKLPPLKGPKPWSDKPVLNNPNRFQIAILTDRTGGHRPGVWMDAVNKVNLLRPEFVVSVGDLIEGYTEDKDEIERQWTWSSPLNLIHSECENPVPGGPRFWRIL